MEITGDKPVFDMYTPFLQRMVCEQLLMRNGFPYESVATMDDTEMTLRMLIVETIEKISKREHEIEMSRMRSG